MMDLIKKAEETHELSRDELIALLNDGQYCEELFAAADNVRQKYVGDEIHLRGLIEFSNICRNNCCYCGLRRDNLNLTRYRIDIPTILEMARHAQNLGLKTVVLQSGEDCYYTRERLCNLIREIKKNGLALTLSIGERDFEDYQAFRDAGADRFLLRIETTDKELYLRHDPGMSWDKRAKCLSDLYRAGLEVGSGCLVGLPGQKTETYADDILFFKNIDADMIGIGPFIPHPDTPLHNAQSGSLIMALKVMALTRLLLPDINIPATTAMETLAPDGQAKALQSGANVIMPNITLDSYRRHYELYPGKTAVGGAPEDNLQRLKDKISSLGRQIATDAGSSKHFTNRQNR